jgi:hypothetical protein
MKLAKKEIIRACEKQMLKMIVKNIDKTALKSAIREKYDLSPGDDILFHGGDISVKNGEIAYRLDFSLRVGLSVFLDRTGRSVDMGAADENIVSDAEGGQELSTDEQSRQMASEIAKMLSEINQG